LTHSMPFNQPGRLRPLAGPRGPQKDDVHLGLSSPSRKFDRDFEPVAALTATVPLA
jgi:hypothetical protein